MLLTDPASRATPYRRGEGVPTGRRNLDAERTDLNPQRRAVLAASVPADGRDWVSSFGCEHLLARPLPTDPPSGSKALLWTILAAFWLWVLLPVAIHYTRRAHREAEASDGRYVWSRSLLHRPVLLWFVVLASSMVLIVVMVLTGLYGDP